MVRTGDFWDQMRTLRASLNEGGELAWSAALRDALALSSTRDGVPPRLIATLRELRASDVAAQLGLGSVIDQLLATTGDGSWVLTELIEVPDPETDLR